VLVLRVQAQNHRMAGLISRIGLDAGTFCPVP